MGSKGSSTTTSTMSLPPEFREAYKKSLGMAQQAVNTPYQAYQGQLVAGLNPTQQTGIANINASQGMALPAIQQGMDYTRMAAQGITPELYNRFYSPYVRDVADATQANILESNAQQQSALKGQAIQAGAFGGDRAGIAAAEMARQQGLAGAQAMSSIYNQGYGQAMQLAGQQAQNYGAMGQQLAGLGVGAQGSVLQGAQAQLAAGAQQQATEQAQLQAAYDQYMQRLAYPYQQAQFYANIAQGLGASSGGTSTTTAPGPSWGSQILGGIGAIGSIFSMSDERAKENIEPVGQLNDGQTIYRYNYKGDPETRIGLIAQEVEGRKPKAVTEIDGLKGVDYHEATEDAAEMASGGGLVTPGMQRMGFAEGGVPFYPWGNALGWVPEGKINGGGGTIPDAPKPYEDKGLDESWFGAKPLTEDQVGGLYNFATSVGIPLPHRIYGARGGLARAHYEGGGGVNEEFRLPSPEEVETYIAKAAADRGIDPEIALKVYRAEGATGDPKEAWQSKIVRKDGTREPSYGPYQLYMEGGLGNEMVNKTGLSPADPKNWKASTDFGLDVAAKRGWSPWMGAKAIGLDDRAGLGGSRSLSNYGRADEVVVPTAGDATGLAAAPEPERPKGLSRLFASEDNPNLIEGVMGRRMSPEARSALMNASFALLAGRSPFFGVNLGEAGKVGMQTYYNALAQKRELAKQQADIGRQGYEAETGRMAVDVQERNALRQQAALVLPIIRNLIALGQPVPPYLMNLLEGAYPEGTPERAEINKQMSGDSGAMAAPVDVAALPGPQSVPVQEGTSTGDIGAPPAPAPAADAAQPPAPPAGDPMAIFSRLPRGQNPYALLEDAERAKLAGDPALYQSLLEQSQKLMQDYKSNGIPMPDGTVVPFPGAQENAARAKRLETLATGEATQVTDYNKGISETQASFTPRTIVVDGLRGALSSTETGKFSELKADLVNAAASLGLVNAEQIASAEDAQVAMKYFAQGVLDSGMKDKIGPQISNADLMLVAKGQGTVENLPVANRKIVGAMYGKLMYDRAKNAAFDQFVSERGGLANVTPTDIRNWEREFSAANPIGSYIEKGIADTPVAGELNVARPPDYLKAGYKYVHPNGRVFIYRGTKEVNGQQVPDAEWVN